MKNLMLLLFFIPIVNTISQEISVSSYKMNIGESSYIDSITIYNKGAGLLLIDSIYCKYTNFLVNYDPIGEWVHLEDFSQSRNIIEIQPIDSIQLRIVFAAVPVTQSNYTQIDTMYFYNNSKNMNILPMEITSTMITEVADDHDPSINSKLYQNYPNPFNPTTKIRYSIPYGGSTTIKIFDMLGREVKTLLNEYKDSGDYEIELLADKLSNGIYYYRIVNGNYSETKKMVLLK